MKKILISLLCIGALFACTKTPEGPNPSGEATIELTETELSFDAASGSKTLNFKASADWTAELSTTDWLTATTKGSAGDAQINISVKANPDYDARTATLTIKAGSASKAVTIRQSEKLDLILENTTYEANPEGETLVIPFKANLDYTVTTQASWIKVLSGKALSDKEVSLEIEANDTEDPREAEVLFSTADADIVVTITQAVNEPYFYLQDAEGNTVSELNFETAGGEVVLDVRTNLEYTIEIELPEWLDLEEKERQLVFTADPNPDMSSRDCWLYAHCLVDGVEDGNYGITMHIVQAGFITTLFAVTPDESLVRGNFTLAYQKGKLLVSNGEAIAVINPADGSHEQLITDLPCVPEFITSDEAGHVILAPRYGEGSAYTIYWTDDITKGADGCKVLVSGTLSAGCAAMGRYRVRGDITGNAVLSAFGNVGASGGQRYIVWPIENGEVKPMQSGTATAGGAVWNCRNGSILSVGPTLADGIYARGYGANFRGLWYAPSSLTEWSQVLNWDNDLGAPEGNNNHDSMAIIDFGGHRYLGIANGQFFAYSNKELYLFNIDDPAKPVINGRLSFADLLADEYLDGGGVAAHETADVVMVNVDGKLQIFVSVSAYNTLIGYEYAAK